jgi:YegS/Rv2252/BmrU family lipid kinase
MTERALDAGFDTIVAAGGDGTSHEVVNGLMARARGNIAGTLGCIPAGSGNDFAVMNGAPTDVEAACRQIMAGATRIIDLGKVTLDNGVTRFFDNAVGIGFDGIVTIECRKAKYLRGMALYLPVVLKTVFLRKLAPRVVIECDGETFRQTTLMTVICNGPREGGGFLVAPTAKTDDGLLDLVMTEAMPKLQVLGMIPRFIKGTHIGDPRVKSRLTQHVVVSSPDPLYLHADGEVLCDVAHRVETWVVPGCLRIIAPQP